MKIRSALLFACMLVVPALAMFSHRVPADVRAAVRGGIERLGALWKSPAPPTPIVVAAGGSVTPAPTPVAPVAAVTEQPILVGARAASPAEPSRPAPPAVAPPVTIPATPLTAADGNAAARLRAAGASDVDCRPMEGTPGLHVASCRVGLDASGQLVRVFHASGRDAESAVQSLLDDVLAWKQRVASLQPAAGSGGAAPTDRRL